MDNLILVGFSCSGKTTLGRNVARRLRLNFVDSDKLIEEMTGRTIPDIFREDGEAAFRAIEREAIKRIMAERDQVVSTGGGAFVDLENRERLRSGNLVIHLQVRPETVVDRLRNSKSGRPRPMLDSPDPLERVNQLMADRKEAYTAAHVTIGVDDRSRYELVSELRRRWLAWQRAHHPSTPAPSTSSTPATAGR
jgi:shikimate kinase